MTDPALARQLWHPIEPVHSVLYHAPEVFAEAASFSPAMVCAGTRPAPGPRARWASSVIRPGRRDPGRAGGRGGLT